jgi:hypothetical protein
MNSLFIDGIGFWSPALPGWEAARNALCGRAVAAPVQHRPAPTVLAANERRRAPDSVLVALDVAQAAVAMSGQAADALASVFTSAHGDLPIVDALCSTLATNPLLLSPTRFHHSVHNAASGYWAIASGSQRASTALAAFDHSFAAGLLEATSQCAAEEQPVLLVGYDTEACGGLASVNRSRGLLGVALVLSPQRGPYSLWALAVALQPGAAAPVLRSAAAQGLADNASAGALPLFEALASDRDGVLALPLSSALQLQLALQRLPSGA